MRSPFELQSLIDWLEKQPAEAEYDYASIGNCLNCQYLRAVGFQVQYVGGVTWNDLEGKWHDLPSALVNIPKPKPWTFGAALSRARALLSS